MTRIQYDEGYTDYFSVSDAQRASLNNARSLIVLRGERFRACVNLIQSLGGGWSQKTDNKDADFGQNDILPKL